MHLDPKDLREQTRSERRAILKALIGSDEESRIQFSEELQGDGAAFFKAFADKRLEGIVSKHALAPYRSGRTKTWLKTKCFAEASSWLSGWTETGRQEHLGLYSHTLAARD